MAARSVVDYKIVSGVANVKTDPSLFAKRAHLEVERQVKPLLAEGWQPLGPAQTTSCPLYDDCQYEVSQTMVKYDT